jgi:hypothetical protein
MNEREVNDNMLHSPPPGRIIIIIIIIIILLRDDDDDDDDDDDRRIGGSAMWKMGTGSAETGRTGSCGG